MSLQLWYFEVGGTTAADSDFYNPSLQCVHSLIQC